MLKQMLVMRCVILLSSFYFSLFPYFSLFSLFAHSLHTLAPDSRAYDFAGISKQKQREEEENDPKIWERMRIFVCACDRGYSFHVFQFPSLGCRFIFTKQRLFSPRRRAVGKAGPASVWFNSGLGVVLRASMGKWLCRTNLLSHASSRVECSEMSANMNVIVLCFICCYGDSNLNNTVDLDYWYNIQQTSHFPFPPNSDPPICPPPTD